MEPKWSPYGIRFVRTHLHYMTVAQQQSRKFQAVQSTAGCSHRSENDMAGKRLS